MKMKPALLLLATLSLLPFTAQAKDGSWFGVGANYEYLSSGVEENGSSLTMEGGYWYLGNVAYGAQVKGSYFGADGRPGSSRFRIYDLGAFWKAGTEAGLYGKLTAGIALLNGNLGGVRLRNEGSSRSFYIGAGGGFLFQIADALEIGPEVLYRHLTAGDGGDQISIGALVAYRF